MAGSRSSQMHGRQTTHQRPEVVTVTPDMAMSLLEGNKLNRPLNQQHVLRLANQIETGKWKFNGDTIKIADNANVLDGQHRLWAVIEAKQAIETCIVKGIAPDAFSTIDTLRKPRSGSDVLSLAGVTANRVTISTALQWLTRWQRNVIAEFQKPINRIENSDVETAYKENPGIERAAERASKLRGLTSSSLVAFFYYVLNNRNPELAERMLFTLENPSGVSVNDPFFRLRQYLLFNGGKRRDALTTIAVMIKATNAAYENRDVKMLSWRKEGSLAEPFPKLEVGGSRGKVR